MVPGAPKIDPTSWTSPRCSTSPAASRSPVGFRADLERSREDLQRLPHLTRGTLEGKAVHRHDRRIGAANTEVDRPTDRGLNGGRLTRQGQRMEEGRRNHGGAELDAGRGLTGRLHRRERIDGPRQIGHPGRGKAEVVGALRAGTHFIDGGAGPPGFGDEDA